MRSALLAAMTLTLALSAGCQTNYMYESMGYGPPLEYAQAQCEIGAMGTEQGMVAWGSQSYVAGAQLGNAIGNEIRKQQFMKNCMVLQGWRQIPTTTSRVAAGRSTSPRTSTAPVAVPTDAKGNFKSPGLPTTPKPIS